MKNILFFSFLLASGCTTSLKVLNNEMDVEGITVLDQSKDLMVVQVASHNERDSAFFKDKVELFSNRVCEGKKIISVNNEIIPIIAHECRSGGCRKSADKAVVFNVSCSNKFSQGTR